MDTAAHAENVILGGTGTYVSQLALGTMTFGAEAGPAESRRIYARARDAGIDFLDTADVYGLGESERIVGALIGPDRDDLVIASKACFPMSERPNDRGLSRRHLTRAVEASLSRLKTDRLDIFYVHLFDDTTRIDDVMRTLDHLQRSGKVVYLGVSNWAAWQIATALGVSAREHLARFEVVQPQYSLVRRQVEVEILPLARAENLAVVPYSPLGAGLLTGKYGTSRRPDSARIVDNQRYRDRFSLDSDFAVAESFTALAAEVGVPAPALALAWVMAQPGVTAPIIGARSVEQLEGSLAALTVEMTPDLLEHITSLAPAPAPATDRTELLRG